MFRSDTQPRDQMLHLFLFQSNLELLTNIEFDLNDKKNNELISDMELHNLFDMTEDVAEFEKIKRAESKLIQRQYEHI